MPGTESRDAGKENTIQRSAGVPTAPVGGDVRMTHGDAALEHADSSADAAEVRLRSERGVQLTPGDVEAIAEATARKVAEIVRAPPTTFGLVDARELAEELGVSIDYIYAHAAELSAMRLGSGPRSAHPLRSPPGAPGARDPDTPVEREAPAVAVLPVGLALQCDGLDGDGACQAAA
jgi:hypothetical protein